MVMLVRKVAPRFYERLTYGIDESAEIEEDGIKRNDAHGLQRIAVNNVGCDDRVPDLDARRKQHECNLPHYPMIRLVDTKPPHNQPNRAQQRRRIRQPEPHLGDAHAVVSFCQLHNDVIAQAPGKEDFGEQGAD